jgi:ketosteroid isomerase-like protein
VGSSITLTRMTIEVSKLGDTATSTALAVLEGGGTELGRRDERELRFDLVKIDGEWRIARVIVGARR